MLIRFVDGLTSTKNSDGLTSTKNSGWASVYTSRWKSIINLVAGQVSQVSGCFVTQLCEQFGKCG